MATNPNNHSPTNNLGYKVTTRILNWEQMCREAEGERWNYPFATYIMETNAGQIVFVQYDMAVTGPPD